MFVLEREKFRFYKVKRGQTAAEVARELQLPPHGIFCGGIVEVRAYKSYEARVGDDFKTLAKKLGVNAEKLKKINGSEPVYPTKKIYY